MADRLTVTVEEAAALLGVGRTLAYELVKEGRIPVLRLGKRCVVPRAALTRMLEAAASEGTPR